MFVFRETVVRERNRVRNQRSKTRLLYFTDFPWFPVTPVADVIIVGEDRKELSSRPVEANYVRPRPRCLRMAGWPTAGEMDRPNGLAIRRPGAVPFRCGNPPETPVQNKRANH